MWVVVKFCSRYLEDSDEGTVGPFETEEKAQQFANQNEYWGVVELEPPPAA